MDHASPQEKERINRRPLCLLSFDLECWDEGDWLAPHLDTATIKNPESDRHIVETLLQLLEDTGGKATFFVTTRYLERYPNAVRQVYDQGHEIGTHGPRHLRLQEQNPDLLRSDLECHHQLLANVCDARPIGYRAPHFSLTTSTAWVLPILQDFGYRYDSSQFAANSFEYGSDTAPNTPYTISTQLGDITEVPIPGFPYLGRRLPFAGGIYFRVLPGMLFTWMLRRLQLSQVPLVYLHPHELSHLTPRIQNGPIIKRFFKYFGTKRALAKLRDLTAHFRFDSIQSTLS